MAARNDRSKSRAPLESAGIPRPWGEFLGVALTAFAVLTLGGLFAYQTGANAWMGPVGQLVAGALYASFGMASYLIALGILTMGVQALIGRRASFGLADAVGFSVASLAGCVLLHITFPQYRVHGYTAGGLAGELVGEVSLGLLHPAGTYLLALTVMCIGLIASTPLSAAHLVAFARAAGRGAVAVSVYLYRGAVGLVAAARQVGDEEDEEEEDPAPDGRRREVKRTVAAPPIRSVARGGTLVAEPPIAADQGEADEDEEDEDEDEDQDDDEDEESGDDAADVDEDDDVEEDGEDDDEAADADATAAVAVPRSRKAKLDEVPEIVVRSESAESAKPKKAAPPRPEELAKQAVPITPRPGPPARKPESAIPGIVRLTDGPYELPPLHLFEAADTVHTDFDREFVLEQAGRLVAALAEFRIKGKVTKIHPGPVITRYEFKPEAGVKLSKIESLENDIAMALEALRIRILAPIPGKSTVGFEVPNKTRETVYIKEILAAENFGSGNRLPLALGKDITGHVTMIDLAKAPHLLVAGATGSGKSVGVNAMVCSMLYTCTPEDVRMVMIDPKMLELSIYEGIPHLLLPVVTDPEKAALALRWAVQEMERRYALLAEAQVRDIAGYNRKLPELQAAWDTEKRQLEIAAAEVERDARDNGEDGADGTKLAGVVIDAQGNMQPTYGGAVDMPERPSKLPYIVVIIDEFADLMMVSSKEVEQCVARIAAKARAAGVHLIVATQRPSVDVITGTIKNNFPSRIAFQVTSEVDSRTILDGKGAKQLLGMGDMLHMDRGMQPQRVHGCYVSEDEILKVVGFVKRQAKPVYNMDIVRKRDDEGDMADADESLDPMYDRAVEIVAEAQKVSTSMLQRRLGIGYNRAAKIVEAMEERGVIGPARGTTPREVYVTAA